MKKLVAAVLAVAAISAGCSSEKESGQAPASSSREAPRGAAQGYSSAEGLGNGLTRAGITCDPVTPGQSVGSSTGSCDTIHLLVWPTPEAAQRGVTASVDYFRTLQGISRKLGNPVTAYYVITGSNWMIETENQSVGDAVRERFGGQFQVVA